MKRNLFTLLVLLVAGIAMAQDAIIKNDKTEILCRVVEIEESVVKYKKWENQTGPTYSVAKSEIFMIRYENGTTETFDDEVKPTPKTESKPTPNKQATQTEGEPKPMKRSIRFGLGVANPILMAVNSLGTGGSSSTFLVQWQDLPSKTKWFTSTASLSFLSASSYNISNTTTDLTYFGMQSQFKMHGHYLRTDRSSLYSGIGIGYIFGAVSYSDPNYSGTFNASGLGWQIDLLGAQYRWNHFGIFGEFGIGYEGIVKSGMFLAW